MNALFRRITGTAARGAALSAVVVGALIWPAAGNRAGAESLDEALVQAYLNNPTLRARRAGLRATDERLPQALSGWRPTVRMTGSTGRKVAQSKGTTGTTGGTGPLATSPDVFSLEVRQPVFRGLRTISATREAENQVLAGREQLRGTEQSILFQAVTAFMDVVRDQAVLELNINNERVLQRQLEATLARFEVGEVTRTDVAQAESRVSRATAQRVAAAGDLTSSRATYEKIIGTMPGQLQTPNITLDLPATLDAAIGLAEAQSPDVLSSRYAATAAAQRIKVVRGELLPEINLIGSLDRSREAGLPGSGSESVSITALLTVPIYQSGSVQSRVRESKQILGQRRVEIEQARRLANESAIQAWENRQTAAAQTRAFEIQVTATQIALEGVEQEAKVGARTVLDVLDAEQEYLNARVSLVGVQRDGIVAQYQLLAAIGRLTVEDLALPTELYDESEHYRQVRRKWFGLGPGQVDSGARTVGPDAQ